MNKILKNHLLRIILLCSLSLSLYGQNSPYSYVTFNFVDGANQAEEYAYDKNGNLTKDLNKKISRIQYNLLNLPTSIAYSNGKSAAYIYDANGNKVKTTYKTSGSITESSTDYCGNRKREQKK